MRILLPIVVAAVPLLIAPHLLYYFDVTPKVLILVFGAAIALILFIRDPEPVAGLLAARTGRWFLTLIGADVTILIISAILSTDRALSLHGGTWRRFGLIEQASVLVLVASAGAWLVQSRQMLRPLLRAIVVTGGAIALYGIFQYFGVDPFLPSAGYHIGEGVWMIVRPPGTLGQAAYFATYLLFPAFIGIAVWRDEPRVIWKAGAGISSALCSLAIVLSGTRAALAGLLIGSLVLTIWMRPAFRLAQAVAVACLLAALAGFYFSPSGLRLRARVRWSLEDVSGGARLLLWRDSLRMASGRPLSGFGPETFALNFPRHESIDLAQAYPDFYQESPHNIFLDVFVSEGLLGLLVAAGYVALGFYAAARARVKYPFLATVLGSCLAAVLVAQQFTSFVAPNALYYGLLLAVLVALASETALRDETPRIPLLPRALVALCGVAVFSLFGAHLSIADYYLAHVRTNLENLNASEAIGDYARVIAWAPPAFSGDLYYSREMAAIAAKASSPTDMDRYLNEALKAGLRATENSEDRQNAWYSLASIYAARNDASAVERCLRASIDSGPNWFKPHWVLAQVLRAGGRLDEARVQAELAAKLNNGKNPEVNQTLYQIRGARQTGKQ